MPSRCPRCRRVVAEDAICCADISYTWKCDGCSKLSTGFAIPYGRCFMCAGELRIVPGYDLEEPMRIRPIREAVQSELDSYHFYKLALSKVSDPVLRAIFTQLYEHELDHLHTLQRKYHTHLDEEILNLRPDAEALLSGELFRGIDLSDSNGGALAIYDKAIEMERRARDRFRRLAASLSEGPELEICRELAAEEEEHVALLETERDQFVPA